MNCLDCCVNIITSSLQSFNTGVLLISFFSSRDSHIPGHISQDCTRHAQEIKPETELNSYISLTTQAEESVVLFSSFYLFLHLQIWGSLTETLSLCVERSERPS